MEDKSLDANETQHMVSLALIAGLISYLKKKGVVEMGDLIAHLEDFYGRMAGGLDPSVSKALTEYVDGMRI